LTRKDCQKGKNGVSTGWQSTDTPKLSGCIRISAVEQPEWFEVVRASLTQWNLIRLAQDDNQAILRYEFNVNVVAFQPDFSDDRDTRASQQNKATDY
jgi:hypothetical protein